MERFLWLGTAVPFSFWAECQCIAQNVRFLPLYRASTGASNVLNGSELVRSGQLCTEMHRLCTDMHRSVTFPGMFRSLLLLTGTTGGCRKTSPPVVPYLLAITVLCTTRWRHKLASGWCLSVVNGLN